jgi:hypothetical protein
MRMNTEKNLPMTEREADTEIVIRLPDQSVELVIFIEARKSLENKNITTISYSKINFENRQRINKKY